MWGKAVGAVLPIRPLLSSVAEPNEHVEAEALKRVWERLVSRDDDTTPIVEFVDRVYCSAQARLRVCGASMHNLPAASACGRSGCICGAGAGAIVARCRQNPAEALLHALAISVTWTQKRLAQIATGVQSARARRYTTRACDADDALALRLHLIALTQVAVQACVSRKTNDQRWKDLARRKWTGAFDLPRRPCISPLNIPDVVALTSHLNYDSDVSIKCDQSLRKILCKLIPCRCLFRGFADTVARECVKNESVSIFLRHAVDCSLAGVVPCADRCTVEPGFCGLLPLVARRARLQQTDDFVKWVHSFPHVVFYALKEVLCFLVRINAPMRIVLCHVYDGWEHFEVDVQRVCEGIRAACGEMGGWSKGLQNAENRLQKQTGGAGYVHKLYKCSFEDAIQNISCKSVYMDPAEVEEAGRAVAFVLSRLTPSGVEKLYKTILEIAGCTPEFALRLQNARDQFKSCCMSSAQIVENLGHILPADMVRAKMVSASLVQFLVLDCVPTDMATRERQKRALAMRLGLRYTDSYVPTANEGCVYFCPQCGEAGKKWRCPEDHAHNLYGIGPHDTFVDAAGELRCNRKSSGASCGGAKLGAISLVGKWVKFYSKWYTLCPLCAAPTSFDLRRATATSQFSCGRCVEESKRIELKMSENEKAREQKKLRSTGTLGKRSWENIGHNCRFCGQVRVLNSNGVTQDGTTWFDMQVASDKDPSKSVSFLLCNRCGMVRQGPFTAPIHTLGGTESSILATISKLRKPTALHTGGR